MTKPSVSIPCALARLIPNTMDVEQEKANGWNDHKILVVSPDDPRIGWIERQIIEQIGEKLYGRRSARRG